MQGENFPNQVSVCIETKTDATAGGKSIEEVQMQLHMAQGGVDTVGSQQHNSEAGSYLSVPAWENLLVLLAVAQNRSAIGHLAPTTLWEARARITPAFMQQWSTEGEHGLLKEAW